MEISLPARLQEYIQSKIDTGRYDSAEAVIEDALQLLDLRDENHEEFLASIRDGFEQIKRGESLEFDQEFEDTLFDQAMALRAERQGTQINAKAS